MTGKKLYLVIETLLCILLAVMLAASAVRIYREGSDRKAAHPLESVYTSDAIADEFGKVAPVLFVTLGMALAGLILGAGDGEGDRAVKDVRIERDLIASRVKSPDGAMQKERRQQRTIRLGGWAAFFLCMIAPLIYILNGAHFPEQDAEAMIASMAAHVFPWVLAGMACLVISSILEGRSLRREIAACRMRLQEEKKEAAPGKAGDGDGGSFAKEAGDGGAIAGADKPGDGGSSAGQVIPADERHTKKGIWQGVVLAAAIVCIIAGIWNGSMQDVLVKAVTICTECVGLG